MKKRLGRQERQLLAYLQMRGQQTVRTGELVRSLRLTPQQEKELFRRMARDGLIARVRRGLYLAPSKLPLGDSWSPSEALAINTLMRDREGRYQVCGPNAFNHYGYDEQVPARVYAYNNRISGERTIGAVFLKLIKVADDRLGDTEQIQTAEGDALVLSSRTRTLVDAVYDWARFDSLPRGFRWIRTDLSDGRIDPEELGRLTLQYGNIGTIRRVGALLERESVSAEILNRLERGLRPSTSFIPLDPTAERRGSIDRRWSVLWNYDG
jgi:predicted transcriptional regulator of viral defense system